MRKLGVVYGEGSATPTEIRASLPTDAQVCFLMHADDVATARIRPLLQATGEVFALDADAAEAATQLRAERQPLDGLITFSDNHIEFTASLAERLGLRYHTQETAGVLVDKAAQRELLFQRGVSNVRSFSVSSSREAYAALANLGVSAILKPRRGVSSRDVWRIADRDALDDAISQISTNAWTSGFLLEEEIIGRGADPVTGLADYLSVETLSVAGSHDVMASVGRLVPAPPFRERGAVFPAGLSEIDQTAVEDLACRALTALEVREGISHTEIKLGPLRPEIIEVNGRLGGHVDWLLKRSGAPGLLKAALGSALSDDVASDAKFEAGKSDGISFFYLRAAPFEVGAIRAIEGIQAARALPDVEWVGRRRRPGDWSDWRCGTQSAVADVAGHVRSFPSLQERVAQLDTLISVTLVRPDR